MTRIYLPLSSYFDPSDVWVLSFPYALEVLTDSPLSVSVCYAVTSDDLYWSACAFLLARFGFS